MTDKFEAVFAAARVRREAMRRASAVEVTGVISHENVSRSQWAGEPERENVPLAAWRVGNGPLRTDELQLVQEKRFGIWLHGELFGTPTMTTVRLRARLLEDGQGSPMGLIVGRAKIIAPDAELTAAIQRLNEPQTLDDPQFGMFTLDKAVKSYDAQAEWLGRRVTLTIEEPGDLVTARALWADQAGWMQRVLSRTVSDLLALKNEDWIDEDNPAKLSAAEFTARMTLTAISVDGDGGFTFWFDDGDLFSGHSIMVAGDLVEGLIDANLAG